MRGKFTVDWSCRIPMGMNGEKIWAGLMVGLTAAWMLSWSFFARYWNAYDVLFANRRGTKVLRQGAVMAPFHEVLGGALTGFGLFALCMPALAVWNYFYHYQGSRSIYLMRRLPDRWELPRRCIAQPALALALCAVTAVVTLLLYFAFYWLVTPKECLQSGQWGMLLNTWING